MSDATASRNLTPQQVAILAKAFGPDTRQDQGCLEKDDRKWPIAGGVVRFRSEDGYASSFAKQWKAFQIEQYDDHNGSNITKTRYVKETQWPTEGLENELVLEAGCGAGRFTGILARTGADVISFDYSSAIDVSVEQNSAFNNIAFAQCDILDMPFAPNVFDRVFCHGVLQHTPDPALAFKALNRVLKPGGRLSVDIYHRDGKVRPWKSKYLWRPITTRMNPDRLMSSLRWFIPKWLPIDTFIKRIPVLANYLGAIIPCWNYHFANLSSEQKVQWAIMDTFDALAPMYDLPVRRAELESWFLALGYKEFEIHEGGTGLVGNGIKP